MATELRFFSGLTSPLPTTTAPSSSSSSGYNSRSTLSIARKPLATSFFNGGDGSFKVTRSIACSGRNRRGGALVSRANLFDRFSRVVKSYAIALISSFEDPEKILEQTVLEMNDDLIKMCKAMTQVLASQKQLENRYKDAQQSSEYWYKRAQLALGKGDEDLAREALKRRKSFSDNATALKTQLDQQRAVVDSLVPNTRILESKIREAKSRKDTLKARAQSATTQTKVSEMVGNLSTNTNLGVFENMEEKVLALECQVEAIGQFTTDDLEGKPTGRVAGQLKGVYLTRKECFHLDCFHLDDRQLVELAHDFHFKTLRLWYWEGGS